MLNFLAHFIQFAPLSVYGTPPRRSDIARYEVWNRQEGGVDITSENLGVGKGIGCPPISAIKTRLTHMPQNGAQRLKPVSSWGIREVSLEEVKTEIDLEG